MDGTLTGTTTLDLSGTGSHGNEGVLHTLRGLVAIILDYDIIVSSNFNHAIAFIFGLKSLEKV